MKLAITASALLFPAALTFAQQRALTSCEDVPGWYDADGPDFDCAWYAQGDNCATDGDFFENFGMTANQACCVCGGGNTAESPGNCMDDQNEMFFVDSEVGEADCSWLGLNLGRYGYLCQFLDVAFTCPETCEACDYFQSNTTDTTPTNYPAVLPISSTQFQVTDVENEGRIFYASAEDFPIPLDSFQPDEVGEIRTTLRIQNQRSGASKSIVATLAVDGRIRGWYNPEEFGSPNDFIIGDELFARDYQDLLPEGECSRVPFEILSTPETTSLGWNRAPSNIRIGRAGVVGPWYQDFFLTFRVDTPVSKIWTDAVHARVEAQQTSPLSLLSDPDVPTLRILETPIVGEFNVFFEDAGLFDLEGLVTQRDGGGLHIAFCS